MRSSSLICLLAVIVASRENRGTLFFYATNTCILVLALLLSRGLAEEELRGVKQYADWAAHTICNDKIIHDKFNPIINKEKVRSFHFDKRPVPKFHSLGPAIPIMIFLPQREKPFPFGPVVGEGGFEPPTPWFVATCSNPLSYRPHPVSTGSVPGSTLKKKKEPTFPLPNHFGLRRCESTFLSIRL
jgi:hypothetical protein